MCPSPSEAFRPAPVEAVHATETFGDRIDKKAKWVLLVGCDPSSPLKFETTQKGDPRDLAGIDGTFRLSGGLSIDIDFTIASDEEGRLGKKVVRATRRVQPFTKYGLPGRVVIPIPRELAHRLKELTPEQVARADRETIVAAKAIVGIFLEKLKQVEPHTYARVMQALKEQ